MSQYRTTFDNCRLVPIFVDARDRGVLDEQYITY